MTGARVLGARKSDGELTEREITNDRAGIAEAEQIKPPQDVSRLPDLRAPWLDPFRGRKRPRRPRLDQLDKRRTP